MARGVGSGRMQEHIELLQYLLYIFNTVFFFLGSMVFAVALYTRFDEAMLDYIKGLGMYHYWSGIVVLMISSALVMVTCFLACCGVYLKNLYLLVTYKVFTVISFIMLLAGSIYILANGIEDSRLFPWIQHRMRELIYQYQWDMKARRTVDIVQEYVGCCGGFSASDYTNIHLPIPDTCRNQVTGNQYGDSCAEIFGQYIEVRTAWITGLSLSLCFFQFFAMMFAICMWKAIKETRETNKY